MKLLAIALLFIASVSAAAEAPESEHISVASSASVEAVPDLATIEVTVACTDMDAAQAKDTVDQRSAKIISLAKSLAVDNADVTASQIALRPDYDWKSDEKTYKGTNVKREITIRLRDLSRYAELIQGLAEVPVTSIDETRMGSSKIRELQNQALSKAIEGAKAKAKKIAEQFGAKLGDVYSISESETDYFAFHSGKISLMVDSISMRATPTFEPGMITIDARIYAVFKLRTKR